jgi:hypothetical protein
MKSLSFWARDHKIAARIIIALCYVILNITGLFLGDLIYSVSGTFNVALLLIPVIMTITGYIFYPKKKYKDSYQNFYVRQKANDFILITATFLFVVFAGNSVNRNFDLGNPVSASIIKRPAQNTQNIAKEKRSHYPRFSKKNLRQQLKAWRYSYRTAGDDKKSFLTVLVIAGAIIVFFFVAALSCNISCSGNEALGTTVLILGIAGIAYGATKLIQRITRGPKAKKEKPAEPENKPAEEPVVQ